MADLTPTEKDNVLASLLRSHPGLVSGALERVRDVGGSEEEAAAGAAVAWASDEGPRSPGGAGTSAGAVRAAGRSQPRHRLPTNAAASSSASTSSAASRGAAAAKPLPPTIPKSDLWNHRYAELRTYRSLTGHTRVPYKYPPNPQLWRWVDNQRQAYKWHCSGDEELMKKSWLTQERIDLLNDADFTWSIRDQVTFEDRLEELARYKEEHGNMAVLSRHPGGLGRWISDQRYRKIDGNLSQERMDLLDEFGFDWTLPANNKLGSGPIAAGAGRKKRKMRSWDEWMDMLRKFKEVHGHLDVTRWRADGANAGGERQEEKEEKEDGAADRDSAEEDGEFDHYGLCRWVASVRSKYRARLANDKPYNERMTLNDTRIGQLVLLGFDVDPPPSQALTSNVTAMGDKRKTKTWNLWYEELKEFKQEFGHCRPSKVPGWKTEEGVKEKYGGLNKWAEQQRYLYRHFVDGAKEGAGARPAAGAAAGMVAGKDDDEGKDEDSEKMEEKKKKAAQTMTAEQANMLGPEGLDIMRKVRKRKGVVVVGGMDESDDDDDDDDDLGGGEGGASKKKKRGRPKKNKQKKKAAAADADGEQPPKKKRKKKKNSTATNDSNNSSAAAAPKTPVKQAHVKWAGKAIALGTFPVKEAEEKSARARELTAEWRGDSNGDKNKTTGVDQPKPSREWVMEELERLGVRVRRSGGSSKKKQKSGEEQVEDGHC